MLSRNAFSPARVSTRGAETKRALGARIQVSLASGQVAHGSGRHIDRPLHVLWRCRGFAHRGCAVLETRPARASTPAGQVLGDGHAVPEQALGAVSGERLPRFGSPGDRAVAATPPTGPEHLP